MRYLIIFPVLVFCNLASAAEWFEGKWIFDANLTQHHNPGIPSSGMREIEASFSEWAGKINVTPRRVKGKKAKLGVPYRVVGRNNQSVWVEVKGPAVEIAKAFNPNLRKQSLRCRVIRISSNVVAFEVPEAETILMYLRRTR